MKDIFERGMFSPMTESEVENFENDMLPQNTTVRKASDVDIMPVVEAFSQNFEHLFEGSNNVS
jgi:hypothetical protein